MKQHRHVQASGEPFTELVGNQHPNVQYEVAEVLSKVVRILAPTTIKSQLDSHFLLRPLNPNPSCFTTSLYRPWQEGPTLGYFASECRLFSSLWLFLRYLGTFNNSILHGPPLAEKWEPTARRFFGSLRAKCTILGPY